MRKNMAIIRLSAVLTGAAAASLVADTDVADPQAEVTTTLQDTDLMDRLNHPGNIDRISLEVRPAEKAPDLTELDPKTHLRAPAPSTTVRQPAQPPEANAQALAPLVP